MITYNINASTGCDESPFLDWLYNNDTGQFKFEDCTKIKVNVISDMFKVVSTDLEFMSIVLADITNEKYRTLVVLWTIIVPVIFTLIGVLGSLGK